MAVWTDKTVGRRDPALFHSLAATNEEVLASEDRPIPPD